MATALQLYYVSSIRQRWPAARTSSKRRKGEIVKSRWTSRVTEQRGLGSKEALKATKVTSRNGMMFLFRESRYLSIYLVAEIGKLGRWEGAGIGFEPGCAALLQMHSIPPLILGGGVYGAMHGCDLAWRTARLDVGRPVVVGSCHLPYIRPYESSVVSMSRAV